MEDSVCVTYRSPDNSERRRGQTRRIPYKSRDGSLGSGTGLVGSCPRPWL